MSTTAAPDVRTHPPRLRFGDYVLDLERGSLLCGDRDILLRRKTFDFLRYLATNPGRLLSKDELLKSVWPNVVVNEDSIVQCVSELRRALGDHDQHLIKTVQGRGYRFEAAISTEAQAPAAAADGSRSQDAQAGKSGAHDRFAMSRGRSVVVNGALGLLALIAVAIFGVASWRHTATRADVAPMLSIVVLPFENLGENSAEEYFAEGVTNDLSIELSRVPGMSVIAHATARTFKDREIDVRQVGRELNVRYLLEGAVRRNAGELRINIGLINAQTGSVVWGERFELPRERLAVWQDEMIGRIANVLNFQLTKLESERLRQRRADPEAADLAMHGWALVYASKTPQNYRAARRLFEQALDRDATEVRALVGLAWTSAVMVLDGWSASTSDDMAKADQAVAQALVLNPNHFVAHHVRGFLFRLRGRPDSARDAFRTAIAINPNFAPGYAQLGATELALHRPEAAIRAIQRAMRLSPRDPSLGPWCAMLGRAELGLGNYQEAARWLVRAIDTGTPIARHRAYLAAALALGGRVAEARSALAEFRKLMPEATIRTLMADATSTEGWQERLVDGLRLAGLPE
jgi:TolB-like protein/DNA-binding winged helix-turn-helix (wHTH) protein/Flp pilus assembly protein TadD